MRPPCKSAHADGYASPRRMLAFSALGRSECLQDMSNHFRRAASIKQEFNGRKARLRVRYSDSRAGQVSHVVIRALTVHIHLPHLVCSDADSANKICNQ